MNSRTLIPFGEIWNHQNRSYVLFDEYVLFASCLSFVASSNYICPSVQIFCRNANTDQFYWMSEQSRRYPLTVLRNNGNNFFLVCDCGRINGSTYAKCCSQFVWHKISVEFVIGQNHFNIQNVFLNTSRAVHLSTPYYFWKLITTKKAGKNCIISMYFLAIVIHLQ